MPQPLEPKERPSTYCAGGRVVSRAGLGRGRKASPLPRFDPRTVHPVACHYNDYAVLLIFIYLCTDLYHTHVETGWTKSHAKT